MLQPKRVKYRRPHSLSYEGNAKGGTKVEFGEYGLVALEGNYITDHQIESARIVLSRCTDRTGKVWIRIFPHMAKTKKPAEVRMGSGKGSPEGRRRQERHRHVRDRRHFARDRDQRPSPSGL